MIGLLLAAVVAAGPGAVKAEGIEAGIRTMCNEGGRLDLTARVEGRKFKLLTPIKGRRMGQLANGDSIVVEARGATTQLLIEAADGRYRRLMDTDDRILLTRQSPDGKYLAVGLSREANQGSVRPPLSSVFLFDLDTLEGRELLKQGGLTALTWSNDGKRLAVGDFARLRIFGADSGEQQELCVVDHPAIVDGKEWIDDVKWNDATTLHFTYRMPTANFNYKVRLP